MTVKQPVFGSIVRLVIIVITLLVAIAFWQATHYSVKQYGQLKQAVNAKVMAEKTVRDYDMLNKQYKQFSALNQQRSDVDEAIKSSGFQQSQWSMRDLQLESASMPREQVQGYLSGVANQPGYFFIPTSFMMKVPFAEDDIFRWSQGDSHHLKVTLNGQYYIRREQ